MPRTEPAPYVWQMTSADVLAHRFTLPKALPAYTAVTVSPGQMGLVFLNNEVHVLPREGLYMVTANLVHDLEEGYRITQAQGQAMLPYDAQITLFDVREKLWHVDIFEVTADDGSRTPVNMTITYRVKDPARLNVCGADFLPGNDGSEMHRRDPRIAEAFRLAADSVIQRLTASAAARPDAAAVRSLLSSEVTASEMRVALAGRLNALGLEVLGASLSPAGARCPHCHKQLSLTEIRTRFCANVDEEGNPQEGCGVSLHVCPTCQTIVGPSHRTCPVCREELFFCQSPGCQTYRRPERGRFCPVCRRACYPRAL